LSEYGKFRLEVGAAATLPPTTAALEKVQGDNPYEALILRHPKTGRVMGFPNVTMAYTRPFSAPPDELAKLAGQKSKNPYIPKDSEEKQKAQLAEVEKNMAAQHTVSRIDGIISSHLNNRFTYGLNSAGVFVYAHDTERVVHEAIFVKAKNITTTMANDGGVLTNALENTTALIRPISDERGFEHIGHFRYGRGITLRDGQLIVSGPIIQAEVRQSLAIGGDLFSTLSAQSAGLTTLQVASQNPADVVSRLHPDELQTAAFQTAGMDKPQYAATATNFIDRSVLGDGKDRGYAVSVEAGQLSRALTLAELTPVKGSRSPTDVKCPCLLMRSDLAFINTGYQVKILNSTAPDESTLIGGNTAVNEAAQNNLPVYQEAAMSALEKTDAIEVVNNYLFQLYDILDKSHQEVEKTLRGEHLNIEPRGVEARSITAPKPGIAPPFSAANRFEVDDPAAIAIQAESSRDDLARTLTNFSDKMTAQRDASYYQEQADKDQRDLLRVNDELEQLNLMLEEIEAGRTAVVQAAGEPSLVEQRDQLVKEQSRLRQSVSNYELKATQAAAKARTL
jgi:hypothetical protein